MWLTQDTLIRGGLVLSMGQAIGDLQSGNIHICGGRIVSVCPSLDIPGTRVINAAGLT